MSTTLPPATDPRDPLEVDMIRATITKLLAESGKLQAEQGKLHREARDYPFLALGVFFGAAITFGKLFFGG